MVTGVVFFPGDTQLVTGHVISSCTGQFEAACRFIGCEIYFLFCFEHDSVLLIWTNFFYAPHLQFLFLNESSQREFSIQNWAIKCLIFIYLAFHWHAPYIYCIPYSHWHPKIPCNKCLCFLSKQLSAKLHGAGCLMPIVSRSGLKRGWEKKTST